MMATVVSDYEQKSFRKFLNDLHLLADNPEESSKLRQMNILRHQFLRTQIALDNKDRVRKCMVIFIYWHVHIGSF
jgi:hypothetical protein